MKLPKFHYAEILMIFIFILDIVATISAINMKTSFWFNPLSAAAFEGNPIAAQAISMGLLFSVALTAVWILAALWLFDTKNWFRFYIFGLFVSLHAFGLASWLFREVNLFNYVVILIVGGVLGYLVSNTKLTQRFLDTEV